MLIIYSNAPIACLICIAHVGICNVSFRGSIQPAITINSSEIAEVQHCLRFSRRIVRIIRIVSPDRYKILFPETALFCDIQAYRQIASKMFSDKSSVHPDLTLPHNPFKIEDTPFALQAGRKRKMFSIPGLTTVIDAPAGFQRQCFQSVRQ